MRRALVYIEGIPGCPYSQSAQHEAEMLERESHNDYEKRTWQQKCTLTQEGQVAIPAMGIKQCLDSTAYKLGEKVPNRRGATFKNFFLGGMLTEFDVPIFHGKRPLMVKDAVPKTISCNVDGVRGSGKRVPRTFPHFFDWNAVAQILITDNIITQEVFERHMAVAGFIVGVGRFRAEKGGTNGRFTVAKIEWQEVKL